MGKVFYDMGLLSTDEVVECSASDLIGQYMGHTGPKTRAYLDKALGKVLFIDEAYRLTEGQYATEAVNELISRLTNPRYAQKMIVILAGYSQDMNYLMAVRPALSSLFPEEITFENINPDACLALLSRELMDRNICAPFLAYEKSSSEEYKRLRRLMRLLSFFPAWGNARDIKTLAKEMAGYCLKAALPGSQPVLSADQAQICTRKMVNMHRQRGNMHEEELDIRRPICPPPEGEQAACPLPCVPSPIEHETDREEASEQTTKASERSTTESPFAAAHKQGDNTSGPSSDRICLKPLNPQGKSREENVPDHVWNQLQEDIKAERAAKVNQTPEERQKGEKIQRILQKSGGCEYGFEWIPQSDGYRCAGGMHFVPHEKLESMD